MNCDGGTIGCLAEGGSSIWQTSPSCLKKLALDGGGSLVPNSELAHWAVSWLSRRKMALLPQSPRISKATRWP